MFLLFLCWGSFLNVVSYRIIRGISVVTPRSFCPHCNTQLRWFDLIPLLSWLILGGKCRSCHAPISFLYPFIELLTAFLLMALVIQVPLNYFFTYFIFFSALIVTIRTDIETMLISRTMTVALIPVGVVCSAFSLLPINMVESLLGCILGYFFLYVIAKTFYYFTGTQGMGQGDLDLIALIGSFTGPIGSWMALTIGSCTGSLIGIFYILIYQKSRMAKIPFGPFLALGALFFVLFQTYIISLLFPFS